MPRLTSAETVLALGLALALFLLIDGPVWLHPFEIDRAVFVSYGAIPLIVAALLWRKRRLRWSSFALATAEITVAKFGVTYAIAIALWAVSGEPPPRPTRAPAGGDVAARSPPAQDAIAPALPTPIDPATTGSIEGRVLGAGGEPIAGALVFVERGLERLVFEAPAEPLSIVHLGSARTATVQVARVGQKVLLSSGDPGGLHTLRGVSAGSSAARFTFNYPLLRSGAPFDTRFSRGLGVLELSCTVHAGREPKRWLGVLAHPFFTFSGAGGRFELRGVPAGRLEVAAFDPARAERGPTKTVELTLTPGATISIEL